MLSSQSAQVLQVSSEQLAQACCLIRPLLKTNSQRKYKVHTIVVFIFLVSNIGGTLLPIGDPPLFLGYLRGVPFMWTLGLWPMWATACGILACLCISFGTQCCIKKNLQETTSVMKHNCNHFDSKAVLTSSGLVELLQLLHLVDSSKTLDRNRLDTFPLLPRTLHACSSCSIFS